MAAALAVLAAAAGGANTAPLAALAAAAELSLAAAVFALAPVPERAARPALPVAALLLALLAWAALPVALARPLLAPDLLPLSLAGLAGTIALFLAMARAGMERGALRRAGGWLTALTGPLAAMMLMLRGVELAVPWPIAPDQDPLGRFSGTVGNPNAAGILFAMLALIASGTAIAGMRRWRDGPSDARLLAALAAVATAALAGAVTALSQSRTALGLLAGGEVILCARFVTAGGRRGWLAAMLIGGGALAALLSLSALGRFWLLGEDSLGRARVWQTYFRAAAQAPWTGYGLGSFVAVNQRQLTPQTAGWLWSFGAAHAAPLQVVLEIGLPGLALLAAATGLVLARSLRWLARADEPVGAAMLLAVAAAMLASLVDIALAVPAVAALAAMLGGLCWGRSLARAPL